MHPDHLGLFLVGAVALEGVMAIAAAFGKIWEDLGVICSSTASLCTIERASSLLDHDVCARQSLKRTSLRLNFN